MAKIKLTKTEFKKQRDALKRYVHFLPTLLLKKQQLQLEVQKIHRAVEEVIREKEYFRAVVYKWVDVFAEKTGIEKLIKIKEIITTTGNIAGVDIPVFEKVDFEEKEYDLAKTPLWVDYGIEVLKKMMVFNAKIRIFKKQDELIREELRITTQRVNLFEKVKIPEARENIRRIQVYLGDMQTAAVVTGKIAKDKIEKKQAKQVAA